MIFFSLLLLSLFLLFYCLFLGDVGVESESIQEWFKRFTLPVVSAVAAFLLGSLVCRTPLAGVIWAVMGWLIPGWVSEFAVERKKSALRGDVKSFITTAAGLYAGNQVTPEVVKTASARFPEPLAEEFRLMLGRRSLDQKMSFPIMFENLAAKYDLPEFKAVAAIIAASERAGGPRAASEGLKQLSTALRGRDRRLQERRKETMEPMIAAGVSIILIVSGFLMDVTFFSHLVFSSPVAGRITLSCTSALILIMVLMTAKAADPKDLVGGD
jgi:tight adherence protein B